MRLALLCQLAICLVLVLHIPTVAIQESAKDRKEQQQAKEEKKKEEKARKEQKAREEKANKAEKALQKEEQLPPQDRVDKKAASTTVERPTNPLATQIELAISLNQLIEPPGENAWEFYEKFVKTYPSDPSIKSIQNSLALAMGERAKTPLATYLQGINYTFTKDDWARAQEYSKRLKELQPKNKELVLMDLFYQGMVSLADKQPSKAEDFFRQGIKKNDDAAYFYNALGRALSEQRKEEESLKAYLKASSLLPTWTYPLVNIALKYLRKGDLEQAQRYALSALNVNATDVEAHAVLANVSASKGNIEEAVKQYEFVISQRPNSITEQIAYGRLMLEQGNLVAAERAFTTVLRINPAEHQARLYLSITAQKYSDLVLADASKQLKEASKENNNAQLQTALADAQAHKGNSKEAIEAYQGALKLEPWQVNTRLKLANLLAETGQTKEAIEEYSNVTKTNPMLKEAYYNLGNLLKKNNDPRAAILEYRKAIAVDPSYIVAYSNLAVCLQEIGELAAAAATYRAILTVETTNTFAASALKEIETKLSQQQTEPKETVPPRDNN